MPKTRVKNPLPIWDELVAELGDPRPYEPTAIPGSLVVPDDLMEEEHAGCVAALDALDDDLWGARRALDDVEDDAHQLLEDVFRLDDVDATLARRERGRAARADDAPTTVLPVWPGDDAEILYSLADVAAELGVDLDEEVTS